MSASKKILIPRREAIRTGLMGGLGLYGLGLAGTLFPDPALPKLLQGLLLGDEAAMAQANAPLDRPVIQFCLIDKIQQAMLLKTPGDIGQGDLIGLDGAALSYRGRSLKDLALPGNITNFRGMPVTALFAQFLGGLAENYHLAVLPQFSSQAGGHSLQNANLGRGLGGLNYTLQKHGSGQGMLGYVGFNIRSDANDSRDAAVDASDTPLPTYDTVSQVYSTLKNTVAPLQSPERFLAFRSRLDALVTRNDELLPTLLSIKDRVQPVLPALNNAKLAGHPVIEQVKAVIALAKAGLGSNFMITIPWDDTNGGGNLSNAGGAFRLTPLEGVAALADAYVMISNELPEAITVVSSDGGRSRNNGDAAGGMTIITGPAELVNNGLFGVPATMADLGNANQIGQAGIDYRLSDGTTTRVLEHRHVLSLVAKLAIGVESEVPYPLGLSPITG